MKQSRTTPAPALDEHDADVYGDCLRDLRQELLEPPEFVFCGGESLRTLGAGHARAIRDGAPTWFD